MSQPMTPAQLAEAQRKNYSEYVAIGPIDLGGARAYNTGHPVSSASVEDGTIDRALVAKVTTKAADAVNTGANPASDTTPPTA